MPPLFSFRGQDETLNDGSVSSDADAAAILRGLGLGVSLVGQKQPQAFPFVSHGAVAVQHVEDDHVPGIVMETLHSKLVLAGDYCVIFHRQVVLSFRFRAEKKPGRVNLSSVLSIILV